MAWLGDFGGRIAAVANGWRMMGGLTALLGCGTDGIAGASAEARRSVAGPDDGIAVVTD